MSDSVTAPKENSLLSVGHSSSRKGDEAMPDIPQQNAAGYGDPQRHSAPSSKLLLWETGAA